MRRPHRGGGFLGPLLGGTTDDREHRGGGILGHLYSTTDDREHQGGRVSSNPNTRESGEYRTVLTRLARRSSMITLGVVTRAETFERMQAPLAERGIEVRHVPTVERAIHVSGEDAAARDDEHRTLADEVDVGYVYPSRAMEGGAIDALLGVPWVNDREAVLTSRNKGGVLAALSEAGLPTPRTTMVSNPAGRETLERVFERFDPPVVVKPNSATRGVGVTRVEDRDSFLGVCDYLKLVHDYRATGDKSFVVQEYLPDARDLRVMTIDGEYAGAVERRLEGAGWKHNVHRGAVAERAEPPAELRRLAERVAAELGIDLLGVDLLVGEGGDRVVVSETNARPTIDDAAKYEPDFYDRLAGLVRSRVE